MLAKKTSEDQITLPKAIVQQLPDVECFEVSIREGEVVLKPVVVSVPGERLKIEFLVKPVNRRGKDYSERLTTSQEGFPRRGLAP